MAAPVLTRDRDRAPRRFSTTGFVALVCAAAVLVRLSYLASPLKADEAGYLMVARAWHLGGPNLYGHYWVDRPPLLIAIYKLASLFPWDGAIRVVAIVLVLVFIVSAAWAGEQMAGARGARWAAGVGAAVMVSSAFWTQEADGELLAAPFVMLAIALTLAAVRRDGWPCVRYGVLAGVAAGMAIMVKQNFGDAIVFAVVLLAASVAQRRMSASRAWRILVGGATGALAVALAAAGYAVVAGASVGQLFYAMYGFRGAAFDVIVKHSLHAPRERAVTLAILAVVSGAIPMLVVLARNAARCKWTGPPIAWAIGVMAATELIGIVLGGSYWPHYLIQLGPALALAAGLWAGQSRSVRWASWFTVASAVAATAVFVASGAATTHRSLGSQVGGWVGASGRPGDTATVLYGHAEVQEATGMQSPYQYLWDLPIRTRDTHLRHFRRLLAGPHAPTWIVLWSDSNEWHIDRHNRLRLDIATKYRLARKVCGRQVWLRDGVHRTLAPKPVC